MGVDQLSLFGNYDLQVGNWTITTLYDERRKKWRLLINNRETIYNIKNEMMEWETEKEAIEYIESAYPVSSKVVLTLEELDNA